jgi:hypothetical protein
MKVKLLTVCTDPSNEALQILKYSLDKYGWDYEILVAPEWKGFSTKLITVQEYLISADVDAFFFCNAYDCVVLSDMQEAIDGIELNYGLDKMVFSAERGCWPESTYEVHYEPKLSHGFNYLNSGLYYSPKEKFLSVMRSNPPQYSDDDQLFFTKEYLFGEHKNIVLDQNCEVFQCYSFIDPDDYAYGEDRLMNGKTGTLPVIIHANARNDLSPIYKMLK